MTANEFVFWLKGIVDSTQFMPTKKTWDLLSKIHFKNVKFDKKTRETIRWGSNKTTCRI